MALKFYKIVVKTLKLILFWAKADVFRTYRGKTYREGGLPPSPPILNRVKGTNYGRRRNNLFPILVALIREIKYLKR